MRFLLLLKVAFRAIARNKLRSALTTLGIVIGVGAVIAMVAIGEGASQMVRQQIAGLGENVINVFPGSSYSGGVRGGGGSSSTLTEEDVEAMSKQVPYLSAVTPVVQTNAQIIFANQNWQTQVIGGSVDYTKIRNWSIVSGSNFNDSAVRSAAKVAMVGQTIVDNLFQGEDPVGQVIRVKNMPFTIIGVLSKKGMNTWGRDQDDVLIVPYTTAMKKLSGQTRLNMAMASAASAELMAPASTAITELLRQRHRIGPGQEDDFTIRTQQDVQNVMGSTSSIMRVLLAIIASVSLLVGGIGIMNIMLVSVTERTREIGIRMAVGAKGWHVLVQFLSESVVLSCFGGLLGIGLGMLTAELVSRFARWPILISAESIFVAFGFAAAIGVFFGYWPARKASLLDPIEALRYE